MPSICRKKNSGDLVQPRNPAISKNTTLSALAIIGSLGTLLSLYGIWSPHINHIAFNLPSRLATLSVQTGGIVLLIGAGATSWTLFKRQPITSSSSGGGSPLVDPKVNSKPSKATEMQALKSEKKPSRDQKIKQDVKAAEAERKANQTRIAGLEEQLGEALEALEILVNDPGINDSLQQTMNTEVNGDGTPTPSDAVAAKNMSLTTTALHVIKTKPLDGESAFKVLQALARMRTPTRESTPQGSGSPAAQSAQE